MDKTKLVWHPEKRKVNDLKTWSANPRKISKRSFNRLKERIKQRGFHDVIKVDTDSTILSGNQRKKALLELGVEEVITLVPNRKLTEEERNSVGLESNITDGDWNFQSLKSFDLSTLMDVGFNYEELAKFWNEELEVKDEEWDEEKELAKIKKPTTKLGDLIILGTHRLICGNSGDPEVLKKLFENDKASMVYSDPPYNLSFDYNKGLGGKKNYGAEVKDNRSYDEYKEFLRKSLVAALSVVNKDAHVFYWSDQNYIGLLQKLYRALGIANKRVCLWIKNGQNPTPGVAFNKCYEPCTYGTIGSPYIAKDITNLNEVMNKEITTGNKLLEETLDNLDVWLVKRLSGKEYEHATSKPPKLHEKAIRRCSRPGDIILDSFSGSGSTLIAGEQLKRNVYAVELEPIFCDLAIRRYEKLTGKKVKIIRHEEQ